MRLNSTSRAEVPIKASFSPRSFHHANNRVLHSRGKGYKYITGAQVAASDELIDDANASRGYLCAPLAKRKEMTTRLATWTRLKVSAGIHALINFASRGAVSFLY